MTTIHLLTFAAGLAVATPSLLAAGASDPPVPVRMTPPVYPVELRRDGIPGVVTINCLIDEKGNVQEPTVVKASHTAFARPALEAVRSWKFKPAKRDGTIISVRLTIPIQFTINED